MSKIISDEVAADMLVLLDGYRAEMRKRTHKSPKWDRIESNQRAVMGRINVAIAALESAPFVDELATLPERATGPHSEILTLRYWLRECLDVINRGVEIVTDKQLGTWNNVRTVVELVPEILDGSRAISGSCDWREDEDGTWITECANAFQFYTGGPLENGAKYCIYCGKPVNEQKRGNEKHKKDKQ